MSPLGMTTLDGAPYVGISLIMPSFSGERHAIKAHCIRRFDSQRHGLSGPRASSWPAMLSAALPEEEEEEEEEDQDRREDLPISRVGEVGKGHGTDFRLHRN